MENMTHNNKCIGCINVEDSSFPFTKEAYGKGFRNGFFIDTEGCGLVQNEEEYFLEIFYCLVCGKKI